MHDMIWANLLHLSFNMWEEAETRVPRGSKPHTRWVLNLRRERLDLQFDETLWDELLQRMVAAGMNMVVLDLGNAVKYQSHPEIAVKNAWSPARLRKEVSRLRRMGLEPIPKLNFSTTHDAWLGPYSRCVSTDTYYAVCRDLIEEVSALFDRPRFFHLGMDEETAGHQRHMRYAVMRQGDLWWHDLHFLVDQVERQNLRSWIWSDYVWHHPEEFFRNMPKSVLQSNWYYGALFNRTIAHVQAYRDLEAHGYDQVPTGSTWSVDENFAGTVRYCRRYVAPERLHGFMQAPWLPTLRTLRRRHLRAIEVTGEARQRWPRTRGAAD
jgi:hypothetical protein